MRYIVAVLFFLSTIMPVAQATIKGKPALTIIELNSGNAFTPSSTFIQELRKVWIAGYWIVEWRLVGYQPHPITRRPIPVFRPFDIYIPGHFEWRWITVQVGF